MTRKDEEHDSSEKCLKYFLYILNAIFCFFGIVLIVVGVWILYSRSFLSIVLGTFLMNASACLIIAGGSIVFLTSFCGCVGSRRESKCLLAVYFSILLVIIVILVMGAIAAVVFRNEIDDETRVLMSVTLERDYGVLQERYWNRLVTYGWDDVQHMLSCCAVDDSGWSIYRFSNWYKQEPGADDVNKPYVPRSCCALDRNENYIDPTLCQFQKTGPPGIIMGDPNFALNYQGCYNAAVQFVYRQAAILIAIGFTVAAVLISGVILSCCLYRKLD